MMLMKAMEARKKAEVSNEPVKLWSFHLFILQSSVEDQDHLWDAGSVNLHNLIQNPSKCVHLMLR